MSELNIEYEIYNYNSGSLISDEENGLQPDWSYVDKIYTCKH
jgi:hypothetical protein